MLLTQIGQLLTMEPKNARAGSEARVGLIEDAVVVTHGQDLAWVGARADLPAEHAVAGHEVVDCGGAVVTPGWVECHTHVVYGGDRAADFERRARGLSYEEITRQGGGIQTTMDATRGASVDGLAQSALPRLERLARFGVTTVEIKSGYGLEWETERRMLEAIAWLGGASPLDVVATFLGAHLVPREWKADRERYLSMVAEEMIPAVAEAGLAEFCDVFCEEGAFSLTEARRVLEAGKAYGLKPKIHSEQLTHTGGTRLATEIGAVSADHLEEIGPEDIQALAASETVPVLLPGATAFLGKSRFAPGRALVDAGAAPALSTDYNPGSSHTANLPLMTTLACTYMGLTPAEALAGVTIQAARALGRGDRLGSLAVGKQADLVVFDVPSYAFIPYEYGMNPVSRVMKRGAWLW